MFVSIVYELDKSASVRNGKNNILNRRDVCIGEQVKKKNTFVK